MRRLGTTLAWCKETREPAVGLFRLPRFILGPLARRYGAIVDHAGLHLFAASGLITIVLGHQIPRIAERYT